MRCGKLDLVLERVLAAKPRLSAAGAQSTDFAEQNQCFSQGKALRKGGFAARFGTHCPPCLSPHTANIFIPHIKITQNLYLNYKNGIYNIAC